MSGPGCGGATTVAPPPDRPETVRRGPAGPAEQAEPAGQPAVRRWRRAARRIVYATRWFTVGRDDVIRPDGAPDVYDYVDAPGSATVLAIDGDGRAALTRQWIYTHESRQWRLPSGTIESGDGDPIQTARRELEEETGWCAMQWESLGCIHGADSFTNHVDHVFMATDLVGGSVNRDPGEADLELHWVPIAEVLALAGRGQLRHAASAFAVLSFALRDALS